MWKDILQRLKDSTVPSSAPIAVVALNRGNGEVTVLQNHGQTLARASQYLSQQHTTISSEEMHLAMCRACDFGITRTAGGVLSCAATLRAALLIDEPGHWLGRIQRDQCREAGLCVVVPFGEFLSNPADTIQRHADQLSTHSILAQTIVAAKALKVSAERDLVALFGARPQWPDASLDKYAPQLSGAGLTIVRAQDWSGRFVFTDVGAIVYYLKHVPWLVPDFSVARYAQQLVKLQAQHERGEALVYTARNYLIEARREPAM